jgi:hypothetical protein
MKNEIIEVFFLVVTFSALLKKFLQNQNNDVSVSKKRYVILMT